MMDWLRELIPVPRMLLYFLFGMGIAYILETVVRLLITKHLKPSYHHTNKRDECTEQEGFNEKTTGVKRIVSREDIEKQKNITQTEYKPDKDKDTTPKLLHAPHSTPTAKDGSTICKENLSES